MIWNHEVEVTGKITKALRSEQGLGTTKTSVSNARRVSPKEFQSEIIQIHPGDWSRPLDHLQSILCSCRNFAAPKPGPAGLSKGLRRMVFKWVNSRLC